jgi:beta-galactosidase
MWCYYNNADEVELYINGKSQGVRRKKDDHQYHVMWRVQFEPGEVKVVARKNGAEVGSQVIKTAGAPDHIRLIADRKSLKADGRSMAFVTVEVVDKDGNLCPNADNQIFFDVKGAGIIAGVDNGCQTSLERFKANNRKAFFGKCLVVIQSTKNAGNVQLTAKSADLKSETLNLSNN